MKKNIFILILAVAAFVFAFAPADAVASDDEGSIYGHISYVEGNPKVIRTDNTQEDAVVNLPVAPGDIIATGDDSKCEFQFDNGTVMRLGKDSRIKVTTVLAKTLTSKWKVTTLELLKGNLYSINQSYNRERFQIITPNAAVNLKNNSISMISLVGEETHLSCDRGKFMVMYGEKPSTLKVETVQKGKGYIVTADHRIEETQKRDIDFLAWNRYIDDNFKNLHYGVSKVPKKIYKYSKGLVYWAEKWSSLFGEWVYDDLFGYVWKPADEIFAYSARPFFHASFTTVNGKMFLVPQQVWGWAPAHLGTWVWMKWGWTWVPGSAFSSGVMDPYFNYSAQFGYPYYIPTMGFFVDQIYGGWDLYYYYRNYGYDRWFGEYRRVHNTDPVKPTLTMKKLPDNVRAIFKRLDNAPVASIKERLGTRTAEMNLPVLQKGRGINAPKLPGKAPVVTAPVVTGNALAGLVKGKADANTVAKERFARVSKDKITLKGGNVVRMYRDWNPDVEWAHTSGVKIRYSSQKNEVVCPQMKLHSSTISNLQRNRLARSVDRSFDGGRSFRTGGSSSGISTNGSFGTVTGTSSNTGGGSGNKTGGPGSGGAATQKEGSK